MNHQISLKECAWLIVDGCFHDYLCAKRRKIISVDGVFRSCLLGCIGEHCPDFSPKDYKDEKISYT